MAKQKNESITLGHHVRQKNESSIFDSPPVTLASEIYDVVSRRRPVAFKSLSARCQSAPPPKFITKGSGSLAKVGERRSLSDSIEVKESFNKERKVQRFLPRKRCTVVTQMSKEESLFQLQNEDGSWNLPDPRLDEYIEIKTETIERLLIECGAKSLGTRIFSMLCKMLATLLVLVYLRRYKPSSFPVSLLPPFKICESFEGSEIEWHAKVAKALTWLKTADKLVPFACTRLQLGNNWEEVIPKLLGFEPPVQV